MRRRIPALLLALAASGAAISVAADPPGRAGRLSYLEGEVLLQPADAGAPEEALLNRPLTVGDRLMSESGARAEMSVGTAALRLDQNTDLSIANLDHDITHIELNSGTLGIHLRDLREGETFEIDTPNAAVLLLRPGDYRIDVDAQGATVLAVRTGEAELDGGRGPIRLRDRQQLSFTGTEQVADVQALGPLTAFDEWTIERERSIADSRTARYVSRDVVGYEDLDSHGTWWREPGYGAVWAPNVLIIDWAPYRFGHWTWISPWGWTWIDHAPWGFAPFHYGRWAFLRHRWCWVPGPRHHRPWFAPAHVGWVARPHGRFHDAVSWFPLGPREVHVPLHPASPRYLRNVNISNTTIDNNASITNTVRNRVHNVLHVNRAAPDALTTVRGDAFAARRAGAAHAWRGSTGSMPRATPDAAPSFVERARDTHARGFARAAGRDPETRPRTTLQPRAGERPVADGRRTVTRALAERRTVPGNVSGTRAFTGAASIARPVEVDRPTLATRPAITRPAMQPRTTRAEPREPVQAQRAPSAFHRNANPPAARNDSSRAQPAARQNERAGFAARPGAPASRPAAPTSPRAQAGQRSGLSVRRD